MTMNFPTVPADLELVRQQVLERFASLLESHTQTNQFALNASALSRDVNADVVAGLHRCQQSLAGRGLPDELVADLTHCIQREIARLHRLDDAMALLFNERQRQWAKNGDDLKHNMLDFADSIDGLAGTLIEKDLLERQSRVLEKIIISHERLSQWQKFVQEILTNFHSLFPFNFFFIAFAEEHGLTLYLYFIGSNADEVKTMVRNKLVHDMLTQLGLPLDALVNIDEFDIPAPGVVNDSIDDIGMITVAVPEIDVLSMSGVLGIAYGALHRLSPQETSVIRSILAVMVMVVGSSKALTKTLSELEFYSTHDPLTSLHNRRYFNDMLEYEVGRSERHGHQFSILMLDLDDFKDVNDTYGHPCGDSVLCGVAEVLRAVMRKGDLATRIGGDEFAIILTETDQEGGKVVAEKLRTELRDRVFHSPDGKQFHITTSIGLVTYPVDAQNLSDLMSGVDIGLYRAKSVGKDSVCTVEEVEDKIKVSRQVRDHAEELREALHSDRIVPFYQPIVDCQTGEIFACETLARLRKPTGEVMSAGAFIETIEKYGLGRELDRAIIGKALHDSRAHLEQTGAARRLFINLSAQEIQGRGVLGFAERLCDELQLPPSSVVFEILERDAIGDMSHMRKFLTELRKNGFAFALDDFGSGYNSFHYLRELHFEFVKLDGTFVRNVLNSKVDLSLVRNLSRLCQDLDIQMVAEFVESADILKVLQDLGVDYAQGYHLGLPVPRIQ